MMNKYLDEFAPKTYIVSAACSTGKTFATCRYIAENQYLHNVIYIAPSLDLLKQTEATLPQHGGNADRHYVGNPSENRQVGHYRIPEGGRGYRRGAAHHLAGRH